MKEEEKGCLISYLVNNVFFIDFLGTFHLNIINLLLTTTFLFQFSSYFVFFLQMLDIFSDKSGKQY